MKVKICGITNLEDAKSAVSLGADALGFIFYSKSKRYIEPAEASKIISRLPPFVLKVGVFVNENSEIINRVAAETGINILQLHGDETAESFAALNYPVIKAFRVNDDFDFDRLSGYSNCTFLLDAFDPEEYGGTGKNFNWDVIPKKILNSIILAGGISEENIEFIFKNLSPYAVDISSSLEIAPGKKDIKKLKNLFRIIKELKRENVNIIKS